jgi:hypothetical protein
LPKRRERAKKENIGKRIRNIDKFFFQKPTATLPTNVEPPSSQQA